VFDPLEPPYLPVPLIDAGFTADDLIPIALTHRPELASGQAIVQAALARLKQEKIRPLVPSVLLRSNATNPSGSLAFGYIAGGRNATFQRDGNRFDIDLQVLWEFQNLGFGNLARVNERKAEHAIATLELFRVQDRIAAEVTQATVQAQAAAARLAEAEPAFKDAIESVTKNFEGLNQTRRAGDLLVLIVRPQEVVAAVQAYGQAYADFYGAVADYNRAQFRLYRALGHPAQALANAVPPPLDPPPAGQPLPAPKPLPVIPKAAEKPVSEVNIHAPIVPVPATPGK
jgi:hypothetical protein